MMKRLTSSIIAPKAKLVGTDALASLDMPVAILASGISGVPLDQVAATAKAHKVLTISTDPGCAKAGKCVLSVHADPKVEILLSTAAGSDAGIEFQSAFRMLVTAL